MKVHLPLASVLLALGAATGSPTLSRRQDSTEAAATSASPSTTGSATDRSTSPYPSSTSTDASSVVVSSGSSAQDTNTLHSSTTALVTTGSVTASVSLSPSSATSAAPSTTSRPDPLPITPTITPALGITGCLLIIAGAALCLIGIKHKWLHIFLSTALLASLAVTVLIIYVMNPPVKDAIQGAYMVAAVLTGLIFGALALVFKEVTEGLGCLLGGFCLAMWFLVLSPGGLISSTTGRAIMIAVFCFTFFGLSFSQYTRNYGLILGTSFAGAQVTVIGIDCFSRAGLKEFWLYIWALNTNAFPINTTAYPITRGIRVEIACTVILAIFGVLSQFRIWKVVKERRARRDADRFREGADKDQLEEAVGRDVEASNQRDREQWEAVYGEKDATHVHVDSGVGSSVDTLPQKRSASVRERDSCDYELADMAGVAGASSKRAIRADETRTSAQDLPTQSEEHLLDRNTTARSGSQISGREDNAASHGENHSTRSSLLLPNSLEGPAVVPLPFSIPVDDNAEDAAGKRVSVVSRGTVAESVNENRGMPLTHLLLRHDPDEDGIEDDRASSIAAIADGETDDDQLSAPHHSGVRSPYILDFDRESLLRPSDKARARSPSPGPSVIDDEPLDEHDDEVVVRPVTASDEISPSTAKVTTTSPGLESASGSGQRSMGEQSAQEDISGGGDENIWTIGTLRNRLPRKFSKVALTYRTNEWAKHIADADEPAPAEEAEPHSPGIQVDHAFVEEAARPVDVEALTSSEAPPSRTVSQTHSNNPYRRSTQPTPDKLLRANSGAGTPVYAFQRSGSATSLNRQNSTATVNAKPRLGARKSSAPLMTQPLIESPVEDALAESEPYRNLLTPMSMASNHNLMGERQQRLSRRPTSTSFNALISRPDLNVIPSPVTVSTHDLSLGGPDTDDISLSDRKQMIDEEDMTLAERKAMIRAQSPQEGPQSHAIGDRFGARQSSLPSPTRGFAHQGNLIYDSHQPKRSNTVDTTKKVTMLTNWRQSLQQDVATKQPSLPNDTAREAMISERRKAEHEQQRQQAERVNREIAMDAAMRNGHFHGAHRDALRRLQAKANKSVQ